MPRVAVAAVSQDAADAGIRVADRGGDAVDVALAASLLAVITHPGMCSLGGACFVTVWPPDGDGPVTVDGGHEMPGRGAPDERFGRGGREVELDFAGGVRTTVGPASVATPGLLAGFQAASDRFGSLPWPELFPPAVERARAGFPFPASCRAYLRHAHDDIYGRDPRSHDALHDDDGALLPAGHTIRVEGLAESLELLAEEGARAFYRGELARRVAGHVREEGGLLTEEDLAAYRPVVREPVRASLDDWSVATNPPPAMGGAVLAATLRLLPDTPRGEWSAEDVRRLVEAQETVARFRSRRLAPREDLEAGVRRLLEGAGASGGEGSGRPREPGSTVHTSAVDAGGGVCSITCSDGYGSGVVPPGTGLWLNNALGEAELNPGGFHDLSPGERLTSHMAPTAGRREDGAVIAVGSPGSDRIPGAILQTLLGWVRGGLSLKEAVEHPRLYVRVSEDGEATVVAEPGLPLERVRLPVRRLPERSLTFGGVEAAVNRPDGGLEAAADERRAGGTAFGG